jgi:hypothetical protein
MKRILSFLLLAEISWISYGQIIADHTVVDKYDKIPSQYITAVKKMLVDIAGESHSSGYRIGMNLLKLLNPTYQVTTYDGTVPSPSTTYLRLGRHGEVGEEDFYTTPAVIAAYKALITSQKNTGNPYSVMGFGWCWDMTWTNPPGGILDPVYKVHWAGSSSGGPNGNRIWGLDAQDQALTGNPVCMDTYLDAVEQYIQYCSANNYTTKIIFTTGPVDNQDQNLEGTENGFQREIKQGYIRSYVAANSSRILFDYADILCWNNSGVKHMANWNDGGTIRPHANIHPDNMLDYDDSWNLIPFTEDGDHIGEVGALRLAKAMWWLLARIAGWDGSYTWQGTSSNSFANTANWTGGVVPPDGSDISFAPSPTYNCVLDIDRTLHNITITQGSKNLTLNGHQLTLTGNLIFSGVARLNASAGRMLYAGNSSQTIENGQFLSNEVYDLTVTLNTDFTVDNSLLINSGNLTVAASRLLTVSGGITNNAGNSGLVIKSDDTGDGKLINNTSSVNGTVALYLTGNYGISGPRYHYFVPPVQSMTIGSDVQSAQSNLSFSNFNGDLLAYDETVAWIDQKDGWKYFDGMNYGNNELPEPFSTLESSEGYNIYLTNNDIITFKGQLNATAHSFDLNYTSGCYSPGWNLIGNPYPCSIDLQGVSELALEQSDGIDNSVYFTQDGAYTSWNVYLNIGTGWESDIIPPMQGFFVHVNSVGKSITLPVSAKTTNSSPSRAKGEGSGEKGPIKKIKLVLNNGSVSDATVVCLLDKATDNFDSDYDAYKLFGNSNMSYIYTDLGNIKYAINSLKEPALAPIVIPVSLIIKKQGTYHIDITEFENLEGLKVILRNGAIETKLFKNASYQFTSEAGTFNNLQLVISKATSGVDNLPENKIKTWYSNNSLYIDCPAEISADKASLIIYDIGGKTVYNNNLQIMPGQTISMSLSLPAGLFITRMILNNREYVSKFVVF